MHYQWLRYINCY